MTDTQSKIRRLERQLADVSNADIPQKIDLLNDLAWALSDTDMQRAQTLSQTAHNLATSTENGSESYPLGVAYSLRTQGYLNMRLGNHPLGLSQLLNALEIFEILNHAPGLPDVFDHIAGIYAQIGHFPESLSYIYKQLEVAQRLDDKRLIANAYNNLANIYFETGDYQRSLETLQQNLQLAKEISYARIECISYLNLTEAYLLMGNSAQALEHSLCGLKVSRAAGFELFEVYAFDFMGKSQLKLGHIRSALDNFEEALSLSRKIESKVTESLILLNLGQAYRELQEFDLALDYVQQSIATAQAINANSELFRGHLLLSEIYEQRGDFAQALHHFKQHQAFKELVLGEKADQRLKVLQVVHDTEAAKKEAEIHRVHNEELKWEIAERQRREVQLRLLESVVKHTADGVLITEAATIDLPGPRIVYINQALTTITGYTQDEVIGQTPRLFQGPKTDRLALDQIRQALVQNRPISVELINYTKAGQEFWVALSISPVLDETGQTTHFVAIQRDITERKRFEEALKINQEQYRLATRAGGVGVWDWNLQTGEFYLDPTIKAILGYEDEEIPNDIAVWANYIHPADSQAVMAAAQAHIEGRTPDYSYEHRMLHKDGSVRWIFVQGKVIKDEQGRAVRMVGTDTDITARKEVEAQVQRQLEYVRALSTCSQTLLATSGSEADNRRLLAKALQYLVQPVRASKIFLYENFNDPQLGFCSRFIVDASAPDIPSALDDPLSAVIPWSIVPQENRYRLAVGQPVGGPIKSLFAATPPFRDYLLNEVHVLSALFFPIHFGEEWWGYIGFDDRISEREWQEEDILLLSAAVEMLSGALQRWQAEDQLRRLNDRLEQQVRTRTSELSETISLLQQEITERERAEAEIQQMVETLEQRVAARTDELAAFFDLTVLAGQTVNLVDVFEQALPRILEVTGSRIICLHLLEANHTRLYLAAQQNLPDEARAALQSVKLTPTFKRWLNQSNDPLMTTTLSQLAALPPAFHLPKCQTYLGAQIPVGHQTEGILSCYRFTERGFGLDEIALVTALAEQMGLMLENHRLRQHTEEMAILQERQRLARDLHDSVTQSLYSLSLFSRAGREAAEDGDMERLTRSLTELERNTLHALREMRLLLYELRPADLEQEGLIRAVELRLNTVERRLGLKLDVQMDEFPNMPPDYEAELYYIIVEAMNNVTKHAAASALRLRLAQADGHLHLQIADDGQGFDVSQTTGGLGVRNIRERVARLNGQLSIFSQPGCGVRLEAIIPYPVE